MIQKALNQNPSKLGGIWSSVWTSIKHILLFGVGSRHLKQFVALLKTFGMQKDNKLKFWVDVFQNKVIC